MTRWCQARKCLLLGRRDEMRLFLDYTRCPVDAWLRRLRVPTCPHAARRWRLAFSSRMLVSVCSWTTESRSPLLASSTSMGHTGSWWTARRNGTLLSMRPTTFLSAFLHVFAQTSVAVDWHQSTSPPSTGERCGIRCPNSSRNSPLVCTSFSRRTRSCACPIPVAHLD